MGKLLGELVTEPELSFRASWSSPCVPGMLLVRLVSGVQSMDRDDAGAS